jgi:hypothetical protein
MALLDEHDFRNQCKACSLMEQRVSMDVCGRHLPTLTTRVVGSIMRLFNAAMSGSAFQALQHCTWSAAAATRQHPTARLAARSLQPPMALWTVHAEQLRSCNTQQHQQRRASRVAAELAVQQHQHDRTERQNQRDLPVACKPLSNVPQHTLQNRTDECQHCGALPWPSEYDKRQKSSSLCCMHGKVDLQYLQRIFPEPTPQPLLKFFRDASDNTTLQATRACLQLLPVHGLHRPAHTTYNTSSRKRCSSKAACITTSVHWRSVGKTHRSCHSLHSCTSSILPSNSWSSAWQHWHRTPRPHASYTHSALVPPGGSDTT